MCENYFSSHKLWCCHLKENSSTAAVCLLRHCVMNHLAVTYSLGGEEAMEVRAALASDNSYVDRKKKIKQI